MTRETAIARARDVHRSGVLKTDLARRIACRTQSKDADPAVLEAYLRDELMGPMSHMGFKGRIVSAPGARGPFLIAERIESADAITVLGYGHADVVPGQDAGWAEGLSPWIMTERDGRWYGRGSADNKGQHSINLAAMEAVLSARGSLGFNAKWLFECGEELGSPGLRAVAEAHAGDLSADLMLSSDGPRIALDVPTVFLGSRGVLTFDLVVEARDSAYHSGNWGGLISNPAIILAHAIASLVSASGQMLVSALTPDKIPDSIRLALRDCMPQSAPGDPEIDEWWGEPGLTAAEKVFGWNSLEVIAFETGDPKSPQNAIPGRAWARCQLRFVAGTDVGHVDQVVRAHLDSRGLQRVQVSVLKDATMGATRLDPSSKWPMWAAASIERSLGRRPAMLPNIGGALPNDVFTEVLGLPTLWVPHSYPGCLQHAPNEHIPLSIVEEGLAIMAGLYWDLGDPDIVNAT